LSCLSLDSSREFATPGQGSVRQDNWSYDLKGDNLQRPSPEGEKYLNQCREVEKLIETKLL